MVKKNSDVRARFAQRLRAIRIPRGFKTARSFAEALEIDENRYTRYERAEVEPDLQLLMKICSLLGATPNDLLCDTIGAPPIDFRSESAYGFADQAGPGYKANVVYSLAPQQSSVPMQPGGPPSSLGEARKAIGFQLAELMVTIDAKAAGNEPRDMKPLEKLRRTVPIASRIEADAFQFISDLPERLKDIDVSSNDQAQMDRLIQELIIAHKPVANDNP